MINTDFRTYDFYTLGEDDGYGQKVVSSSVPSGTIKMAVYTTSQVIQDNINYKDCRYMGLTQDENINDSYVIQYNKERLKVQYIQPKGRYKQIYLAGM